MKKLTISWAAERMHVSPQFLRVALQLGKMPEVGFALKLPGSPRWNYYIYPKKFEEYVGTKLLEGGDASVPFQVCDEDEENAFNDKEVI